MRTTHEIFFVAHLIEPGHGLPAVGDPVHKGAGGGTGLVLLHLPHKVSHSHYDTWHRVTLTAVSRCHTVTLSLGSRRHATCSLSDGRGSTERRAARGV